MRLVEVLRQCSEIERHVAGVYQAFAEHWTEGELGSFWSQMARTENTHADVLEAATEYVGGHRNEPIDAGVIARIRGHVRGVTSLRRPLDLDDALRSALEVERIEFDRIYELLVTLVGEGFPRVSKTIAESLAGIERHHASLLSIIDRYASDPHLVAEASRWRDTATKRAENLEESLRDTLGRALQ
jgi:rubrerythrin